MNASPMEALVSPYPVVRQRQTLLFDADDTLWENNIYFERAIAGFIALVDHPTLSSAEVREAFNTLEHERVKEHGYGTASFRSSMLVAWTQLRDRPCGDTEEQAIHSLADSIVNAEVELLPAVRDTLERLHGRHRLLLVTKGDHDEQLQKLRRSGLAEFFEAVEVVREKHRAIYEDLRSHHRCEAASTWMIGNSPRSDINPALAAGLNAIFVPHASTWVLEHEEVHPAPAGQQLLHLPAFSVLAQIFV